MKMRRMICIDMYWSILFIGDKIREEENTALTCKFCDSVLKEGRAISIYASTVPDQLAEIKMIDVQLERGISQSINESNGL